jgi:hypothetical protein
MEDVVPGEVKLALGGGWLEKVVAFEAEREWDIEGIMSDTEEEEDEEDREEEEEDVEVEEAETETEEAHTHCLERLSKASEANIVFIGTGK